MSSGKRTWGRLYAGTRNHRKIKILAHRHPMLWMAWYVLLDMAIEIDDDGWIYVSPDDPYTFKELAKELRIRREDHVKELCKSLEDLGMIASSNRGIQILSYNERNFDSDVSTARVQKYRERQKDETLQDRFGNGHETKYVTPQIRTDKIRKEKNIKNNISLTQTKTKKPNGTYSDDFELFWASKIHRPLDRKADAWRTWQRLAKAKKILPITAMIQAVERYNAENLDKDTQYLTSTHKYLENELFLPPPDPPPEKKTYSPLPDCPLCHGKGIVEKRKTDGRLVMSPCECVNEQIKRDSIPSEPRADNRSGANSPGINTSGL